MKLNPKMKDKAEWAWRAVCFALLVANLYLKGNFVSLETYNADKAETEKTFREISTVLTTIEERDKVNDRQDHQLQDHETRIRALELRK